MDRQFQFPARIPPEQTIEQAVVDGDTADFMVDLGFSTYKTIRVRLKGVNTAEIYGTSHDSEEFELGKEQKDFVIEKLRGWPEQEPRSPEMGWPYLLSTEKTGKYGRYLADIEPRNYSDSKTLVEFLIEKWPETER